MAGWDAHLRTMGVAALLWRAPLVVVMVLVQVGLGETLRRDHVWTSQGGDPLGGCPSQLRSGSTRPAATRAREYRAPLRGRRGLANPGCPRVRHADHVDVSSVLKAMNVPLEYAMGTLRFSVGRYTTANEIDQVLDEITQVVNVRVGA